MNKPEPVSYNAFRDDEEDIKPNAGLKLNNNKSSIAQKEQPKSKAELDAEAAGEVKKLNEYKKQTAGLTKQFVSLMTDKTLQANKDLIQKEIEKEVIANLAQLALKMDSDQNLDEGTGSVGLCTLQLQTLIMQRDKINLLEFTVKQLADKINLLEKQLAEKIK